MQLLRITRKSDDTWTYVAVLLLSVIAAGITLFGFIIRDEGVMPIILGAVAVVIGVGLVQLLAGIISPFQRELVIESNQIRFGRADRPKSQKVLQRSQIVCFMFDSRGDLSFFVHVGKAIAPVLAPDILQTAAQMEKVAAALQENWPEVPVLNREQFQAFCRQNPRTRHPPNS